MFHKESDCSLCEPMVGNVRILEELSGGETAGQWEELKNLVNSFQLNDEVDRVNRKIFNKKTFGVRGRYLQIMTVGTVGY